MNVYQTSGSDNDVPVFFNGIIAMYVEVLLRLLYVIVWRNTN